jgi:hypothetical protein
MADGGKYKGPRDGRADYFDDYMGDNAPPAIFDGDGMRDYDAVRSTATQKGIVVDMHCRACSKSARIELEWPELFVVGHADQTDILPAGWKRSAPNGAAYPEVKCACGAVCSPVVTPDWAAKQVEAALKSGLLSRETLASDEGVQQLGRIIASRRAQHAR